MDIVAGVQASRINDQRANFPGLRGGGGGDSAGIGGGSTHQTTANSTMSNGKSPPVCLHTLISVTLTAADSLLDLNFVKIY